MNQLSHGIHGPQTHFHQHVARPRLTFEEIHHERTRPLGVCIGFPENARFLALSHAVGALAVVLAFVVLVVREKTIVSRRLVRPELPGLLGGGLALVIMAQVSSSGFTDAGGPADWFLIVLACGVDLVATIVLTFSVMGWLSMWRQST